MTGAPSFVPNASHTSARGRGRRGPGRRTAPPVWTERHRRSAPRSGAGRFGLRGTARASQHGLAEIDRRHVAEVAAVDRGAAGLEEAKPPAARGCDRRDRGAGGGRRLGRTPFPAAGIEGAAPAMTTPPQRRRARPGGRGAGMTSATGSAPSAAAAMTRLRRARVGRGTGAPTSRMRHGARRAERCTAQALGVGGLLRRGFAVEDGRQGLVVEVGVSHGARRPWTLVVGVRVPEVLGEGRRLPGRCGSAPCRAGMPRPGDLGVVERAEVAEHDGSPEPMGVAGSAASTSIRAAATSPGSLAPLGTCRNASGSGRGRRPRRRSSSRHVGGDPVGPGAERGALIEAGQTADDGDERLLGGVGGVGVVAGQPTSERVDRVMVAAQQVVERDEGRRPGRRRRGQRR